MAKAKTQVQEPGGASASAASTAVATVDQQALAIMQEQMAADAGAGFEEASASAFAIPFLQILQSGSPQCKRSEGAFIPGAQEGMFLNTVTGEIFDGEGKLLPPDPETGEEREGGGVVVVPCHYTQRFIEWQKRETGGGFVAEHPPTTPLVLQTVKDDKGRDCLPNGNVLVDTRNHFCIMLADGRPVPVMITFSSTQVKKSKNWMSKMQGIQMKVGTKFVPVPMMSRMYRLTTVPEKNDKGSWMGWKIVLEGEVTDPAIYGAAQDFRKAVIAGTAKASIPGEGELVPSNETVEA